MVDMSELERNIERVLSKTTAENYRNGLAWYAEANRLCQDWSKDAGISLRTAVDVLAATSPRLSWSRNVLAAESLITEQKRITGVLTASYVRAEAILGGRTLAETLKGPAPKVRAFADNVENYLTSMRVTIDAHAFDLANNCVGNDATRKDIDKLYEVYSEAYRNVAKRQGLLPLQVQAITWLQWRQDRPNRNGLGWGYAE